jgi:cytochrome c2
MRYLILLLLAIGFVSCWNQQWEDRVASGDTGSATHGKNTPPDTSKQLVYDCMGRLMTSDDNEGKALFIRWCASCHNASSKNSTGPGLMGVLNRIPGGDWKYEFVRNADSIIKSGDAYANAKFVEYNKSPHTRFPNLTNEEIDLILNYCN